MEYRVMAKKNKNRTQTTVTSMSTTAIMEATDAVDTETTIEEVTETEATPVVQEEPVETVTDSDTKYKWISDITRNGFPEELVETTFTVTWQNKRIVVDLRDCDILKAYGYPFVGNERRADFAVPHYLGLATKKLYLPCTTDGKFSIEEFTGRKGTELLNTYFKKVHEFIEDQNNLIKHIYEMKNSEVDSKYSEFTSKYGSSERIKL